MQCMQFLWLSGSWKAMAGCMSIHRYLKSIDGIPDPKGLLSTTIPSAAIPSANIIGRIDISLNLVAIFPVTVQRIDVVTSHTASHRSLSYADGTIAQSAYYLWRMYDYISRKIIFVTFFYTNIFYTNIFFTKIYYMKIKQIMVCFICCQLFQL